MHTFSKNWFHYIFVSYPECSKIIIITKTELLDRRKCWTKSLVDNTIPHYLLIFYQNRHVEGWNALFLLYSFGTSVIYKYIHLPPISTKKTNTEWYEAQSTSNARLFWLQYVSYNTISQFTYIHYDYSGNKINRDLCLFRKVFICTSNYEFEK